VLEQFFHLAKRASLVEERTPNTLTGAP